ncbi:MAG: ABC transporter substrate-binding protein [Solirubrobacterales bacterium]|nr:MAG: ABC transporter substrate-binding protein [Solirubrobacterales bacterium]
MTNSRSRACLVSALAAFALVFAGCGEKKEVTGVPPAQQLTLMLDYLPNADHAPLFAAQGEGDFRRAGLDVSIRTPSNPADPLSLLAAGKVDLAISYEPELLLARDRGEQLVAVGALVQRPLTAIISVPRSPVTHPPGDLGGKTVGTAGIPYQHAYLVTILRHAGINPASVHEVNVGFNLVPAMLSHRVDATLGAYWNVEAVQLAHDHRRPTVLRVDQAGVPNYDELVIVARRDYLANQGTKVRRFMQALSRGAALTRSDPARSVHDLLALNPGAGDAAVVSDQVRTTLPAFFPTDASKPVGYMDPGQWAAYGQWMLSNRLVAHDPVADQALTDEFLPGRGL